MRIGGFQLGWLRRRWWVLALSVLVVTAMSAAVQRPGGDAYSSEALLVVRSGATQNTPGSANEANRLAVTYSQLIPQDSQVLERVARTLGVERREVEQNVTVLNDPNTSILRVRYAAGNERRAVDGARAFADALAGPTPVSSNFNGLGLSRLPDSATRTGGSATAIPVGIILGLCLGIVLVLAWERADGRIDRASDLEDELPVPVTSLKDLSGGAIIALMERWKALSQGGSPTVAVVAATTGYESLTAEVAVVFATTVAGDTVTDGTGAAVSLQHMVLYSGGAPETREVGEAVVQRAGVTVLVVAQGTRVTDVRRAVASLSHFGVEPAWALFAGNSVVARAKRHYGDGQPMVADVASAGPALTS